MPIASAPKFAWRIKEYSDGLHREFLKRTYKAAELVKTQVQRNLRVPGHTHGHSKPGEFPHAWTGLLLKSIMVRVEAATLRAWVYSNLSYALFLEFSTRLIHGRSFLRRTLYEMREKVRAVYFAPLPPGLTGTGKVVFGKRA
jgi:hypothetical protein